MTKTKFKLSVKSEPHGKNPWGEGDVAIDQYHRCKVGSTLIIIKKKNELKNSL